VTWRLGDRAGRIFAHVSDGIVVLDRDWRFLHVNPEAARLLGRAADSLYGLVLWEAFPDAVDSAFWQTYLRAMETQEPQTVEAYYGPLEGWFEVRVFPAPEGLSVYLRNVSERRAGEEERGRLIARLRTALVRSEQLRELTDALARTLSLQEVANLVATHAQTALGCRFAGVALAEADRQTMRYLSMAPLPDEVVDKWSEFPLGARVPASDTVRRQQPLLFTDRDEIIAAYPDLADDLDAAGTQAMANMPLIASGRCIGALMATWTEPHDYDDDELRFLRTLAGQAAQAVERAQLLARQRSVAVTLQQAILPQQLPSKTAGLELAACYEAAETGVDVGGDWYDAVVLPDGRLALSVGDVAGHGVAAAALMAQLRNAARAYAEEGHPPATLVTKLDQLLSRTMPVEEPLLATIVYAIIDPRTGVLRWTNAGHPPPVLVGRDGARLLEAVHGPPLGVATGNAYGEGETSLGADVLLLYSDGLIERRHRSLTHGLEMLLEVAPALAVGDLEQLCDQLPGRVLEARRREDDLCLLAARRTPIAAASA
jgi:PAS domain S-box-containing protein